MPATVSISVGSISKIIINIFYQLLIIIHQQIYPLAQTEYVWCLRKSENNRYYNFVTEKFYPNSDSQKLAYTNFAYVVQYLSSVLL